MKFSKLLFAFSFGLVLVLSSCEKEPLERNLDQEYETTLIRAKKKKGGGNTGSTAGAYVLTQAADFDALSSFSIKGNKITLFSDPTVAIWGTDFYGNWSGPFQLSNNSIQFSSGLSTTTYDFSFLNSGGISVSKTVVIQPYASNGVPTTNNTTVGVFTK